MDQSIEQRLATLELTSRTHDELFDIAFHLLERQEALLAEVRRDTQQTQRLWVRLAQRYGWLEDDDLPGVE